MAWYSAISGFQDEAAASETLLSLGDLALTARVLARAAENNTSPGEFTVQAVGSFAAGANDDEWLNLLGRISQADDPSRTFLRHVLLRAAPA